MSNKTLIPAFKAQVGDWNYYICHMKYGEVARQVQFAHELSGNKELSNLIQRGISKRTSDITQYLINSPHRFLGALIVAAWGGEPQYLPVEISDADSLLDGLDREFGVLTFDGTQQYFALDGQHRLRAIKDAVMKDQSLLKEDICVIMVAHYDTEDGRTRTRRLFTNINRNAKVTTASENIVLDEDDGIAIITRRLLAEHEFFSKEGIVRVMTRQGDDGELALAGASIPKTEKRALTSISILYDMLKALSFDQPKEVRDQNARPNNDVLETSYEVLSQRLMDLLAASGDIQNKLEEVESARDLRAPKLSEETGNPFMRPVVQKAVTKALEQTISQGTVTWQQAMERLSALDWKLESAPWTAVYQVDAARMLPGKDFANNLHSLLVSHLAPPSKKQIRDARRLYKELRGTSYPISEEELFKNIADDPIASGSSEV